MTIKTRVYELAIEAGMTNQDFVAVLVNMGYPIKSHSSTLEDGTAQDIRRRLGIDQAHAEKKRVESKRRGTTIIRRRPNAVSNPDLHVVADCFGQGGASRLTLSTGQPNCHKQQQPEFFAGQGGAPNRITEKFKESQRDLNLQIIDERSKMAGIVFGLSAPEALERFSELVDLIFDVNDELTARMFEKLQAKADECGIHQLDYETILLRRFFTKPVEEFMMVRGQAILWPTSAILLPEAPKSWRAACDLMDWLNQQEWGGYMTWRLPRIEELRGLVQPLEFLGVRKYFAAKLFGFGVTPVQLKSKLYWSGSVGSADNRRPFCLNLKFGGVSQQQEDRQHYVWPVVEI